MLFNQKNVDKLYECCRIYSNKGTISFRLNVTEQRWFKQLLANQSNDRYSCIDDVLNWYHMTEFKNVQKLEHLLSLQFPFDEYSQLVFQGSVHVKRYSFWIERQVWTKLIVHTGQETYTIAAGAFKIPLKSLNEQYFASISGWFLTQMLSHVVPRFRCGFYDAIIIIYNLLMNVLNSKLKNCKEANW